MFQFLLGLAGVEVRHAARRIASTALLFALGGVLLAVAVVGLLIAAFVALADAYDPIVAALLVAAIAFVGATILLVIAYARLKSPQRRAPGMPISSLADLASRPPGPAAAPGAPPPPMLGAGTVIGVAAVAAILGVVLGRRL